MVNERTNENRSNTNEQIWDVVVKNNQSSGSSTTIVSFGLKLLNDIDFGTLQDFISQKVPIGSMIPPNPEMIKR